MNIWETRYYNAEKDKTESPKTFQIFQQFLQLPIPRSLIKLTQVIYFPNEEIETLRKKQEFKRKYNQIQVFSHLYKFFERAIAYDNYQRELHMQKKLEKVHEWELPELEDAMTVTNIHKDTLKQVHTASEDEFPLTKKAYAERAAQESYTQSVENVYNIVFGGVKQNKNDNTNKDKVDLKQELTADVIQHKSISEKNKENDEYFKQLERDMEKE